MQKSLVKFDTVNTELLHGINLIEASAGTGKTYVIAMLVLRFVVEHDMDIKKILVVTFTRAATAELKNRIRKRLQEAKQSLISQQTADDDNLRQWLAGLSIEASIIIKRLNQALFDIDQASIFTIHGFCQRILSEHALESGQLFATELMGDISAIKQTCTDDFWRRQIYTRTTWEVSLLTADYQTPEQLLASVDFATDDAQVLPDYADLEQKIVILKQQVEAKKTTIIASLDILLNAVSDAKFSNKFTNNLPENYQTICDWLDNKITDSPHFTLFTHTSLVDALNGNKFRQSQKNPIPSSQQKEEYIASLDLDTVAFTAIDDAIKTIKLTFRRALLHTLQTEVDKQLTQLNVLSFDHLISRLYHVLSSEKGTTLQHEISQRYQVAMIDEFQDTDKNQWFITSTLFNSTQQYLYLIGDPKQAIYKFRGADIHSYFAAQEQAEHCFTLDYNWRSHPCLVSAINTLFNRDNAFYSQHLHFHPVQSGLTATQGQVVYDNNPIPPLVLWQLAKGEKDYWTAGKASTAIQDGIGHEILHLLSTHFAIQDDKGSRKILAKDIAILVRSHAQAQDFKHLLNDLGVMAVINSKESVFSSTEAADLYTLLQAIAQPSHHTFAKQALALTWFNLDGQQLFKTIKDTPEYQCWVVRLQRYQSIWRKQGFMVMMQQLMIQEKISIHLSKTAYAERRITNLQHIIELLQQAIIDEYLGINKTLDWLAKNITDPFNKVATESLQLRLESDEYAVQIMTLHSAKGLQFPVVFCPFLWQRGTRLKKEKQLIKCYKHNKMIADLGTEQFELHRKLAIEEELAEDIRIFYVAVTRAQYRCYINWADVRTKDLPNHSAMAYLLANATQKPYTQDFAAQDFEAQQNTLKNYSIQQAQNFEYRLLSNQPQPKFQPKPSPVADLIAKQKQRLLYTAWQMSSYTSLAALSQKDTQDTPEIPTDKAREQPTDDTFTIHKNELPRGTHTGNVIHDLLESTPFNVLFEQNDMSEQRNNACMRYGLKTDNPKQLKQLDQLLHHTVSTFLSTGQDRFNLKQLTAQQCLKEMPFYLPATSFNTHQINTILADCPTYQPLTKKIISGYLTGFIDLICEYKGKYYVLDYKSNHLPNYQQDTLVNTMRQHNYGLQYWVYSLVLHQYLQNRLTNYNYEKHFGGIKYLFVRGMNNKQENSGVYQTRPEFIKIKQLLKQLLPSFVGG